MIKKSRNNRGFTLIELMIAMTIFVVFTGILINSYTSIVKAQREANEYRILYVEARQVFDRVADEVRNGVMRYDFSAGDDELSLISPDGTRQVKFEFDDSEGAIVMQDGTETTTLNSDQVSVEDFSFVRKPDLDPYDPDNVRRDVIPYQPMVTIYGKFKKELSNGKEYEVEMRTTISSRFYNVTPEPSGI